MLFCDLQRFLPWFTLSYKRSYQQKGIFLLSSKLWQPFSGWWFPIFLEGFTPLLWGKDETQSWRQMGETQHPMNSSNSSWPPKTQSFSDFRHNLTFFHGFQRPGWYSQGDVYLDCQWRQSYSLGLPGAARDRWRIFNPNSLVSKRQLVTCFIWFFIPYSP